MSSAQPAFSLDGAAFLLYNAKLGDTLPQLIKRFGNAYTQVGSEQNGNLTYRFRSATYSIDAMMSRCGDKVFSNVETYYSDKPLQANGDPPTAIVRGVMNVTAPGTKWREVAPVGTQRAAFVTSDGLYMAAILPPDKSVNANSTFTIVVGKIGEINGTEPTRQPIPSTTPDDSRPDEGNGSSPKADDALAVTLPTGKVVHFQTIEEKANYEAAAGMVSGSATPTDAVSPQPLMVVGQPIGDGTMPVPLSDGNVAIRAQIEAQAYEANEIAADQKFKGQNMAVYGVITSFGTDLLGSPYVIIDRAENSVTGVQCTFGKDSAPTLATLQKGQIIAVIGTHNGKFFNVQLGGCSLIPWKKPEEKSSLTRRATEVPRNKHQ